MIALDTNVVVRLLVRDDPDQYAAATALLERALEAREPCYLSDAVLCEVTWVLTSVYDATRADVLAALSTLASDDLYHFDDREALLRALRDFEAGRAEFADYLIGARATGAGARTTYTFDRELENHEGFTLSI